jgi:hypothetical protein
MKPSMLGIVCLVLLAVVTGCNSSAQQGDVTATSTVIWSGITREQYEQARAKWRSQGVEEYEARVEYHAYSEFQGIWSLHVRLEGDRPQVLNYIREPGLDAPLGFVGSHLSMPTSEAGKNYLKEQLQMLTLEGQFDDMPRLIDGNEQGRFKIPITFDGQLGYPTSVGPDLTPKVTENSSWTLQHLDILKQSKPTLAVP